MNNKEILEYLKTIGITVILMIVIIVGIAFYTKMNAKKPPSLEDVQKYKTYQIIQLISEYESLSKQDPKNYFYNIKLGLLSEQISHFKEAEKQYKIAMQKASYRNLEPIFMLTNLYIKLERPDDARKIIDALKEYPDASLIKTKCITYYKIGTLYFDNKKYEDAITLYKNSLYYYRRLKNSDSELKKQKNLTLEKLSISYVNLASESVAKNNIVKATNILLRGLELTNASGIMSKLGELAQKHGELEDALRWYELAQKKNPNYVNYKSYVSLIQQLIAKETKNQDDKMLTIYKSKEERLKRFILSNVLEKDDVIIDSKKTNYKKLPFGKGYEPSIAFLIRNNSSEKITPLTLIIKTYDGEKLINVHEQKVINASYALKPGRTTKELNFRITIKPHQNIGKSGSIKFAIYAYKTRRMIPILLKEIDVPKTENK